MTCTCGHPREAHTSYLRAYDGYCQSCPQPKGEPDQYGCAYDQPECVGYVAGDSNSTAAPDLYEVAVALLRSDLHNAKTESYPVFQALREAVAKARDTESS